MDQDELIMRLMDAVMDEDRQAVENMLSTMDDYDMRYFVGYVDGYVTAYEQINAGMRDEDGARVSQKK